MPKKHYDARCHCGRLTFAFDCEEIRAGVRCNCSICIRKGAIMSTGYIPACDFVPIADPNDVVDYRWNDRVVGHVFCRTCGIYPYHGDSEMGYRVNLGCVEGLDALALDIGLIDGRSMPLAHGVVAPDVSPRIVTLRAARIDHVILAVNDVDVSTRFYVEILGFALEGKDGPFTVVRVSPDFILQLSHSATQGGEHLAFDMASAEFDATFARIKARGIGYGSAFDNVGSNTGPGMELGAHGMGPSVYFFDPNKHLFEIRTRRA